MKNRKLVWTSVFVFSWLLSPTSAHGIRLKDMAALRGARTNQLSGFGIVVGLSGSGDGGIDITSTSLTQILKSLGVDSKGQRLDTKNAAAVMVTATLPAFARVGSNVDVNVSSIGSATSLEGGTLVMTSLKGADNQVYAMAQGKIITQRPDAGVGKSGTASLVSAQVLNGATLEREIKYDWNNQRELRYQLNQADFTTAARVAHRINEELSGKYATPLDAGSIDVIVPYGYEGTTVDLIAQIEAIDVETDRKAKVLVNPRTGTVILGEAVRVLPVAVAHKNLRLEVRRDAATTGAARGGAQANVRATPAGAPASLRGRAVMPFDGSTSIGDVVAGLNEMGAAADELVALMQALQAAGALMAELEVQ